jgi:hypothetical protein
MDLSYPRVHAADFLCAVYVNRFVGCLDLMTDQVDTLDEILVELESHFAVPAITANKAHYDAYRKLSALLVEARHEELLRLNAQTPNSGSVGKWLGGYLNDRIKELQQGTHNGGLEEVSDGSS